jgi:pimeloyl-[acyl-carrier protein] methyl ester esterase
VTLFRETTGAGPDVALLHGWGLHGGVFEALARELSANFRVHALDLPGHGHSPWAKGCGDLEGIARAVAAHLPETCRLVGWSLGGLVALRIATLFPERVPKLVLVATSPKFLKGRDWPHGIEDKALAEVVTGLRRDWKRMISDFMSLQVRGDEHQLETLRELKASLFAHGEPSTAALDAGLEILRHADLRGELKRVRAPTLVIAGAYDRLTPPGASEALAAGIAGSRLEIIPRAAHAPFLSHRERFVELVGDFLAAP